jgi:Putative endonuclease, protein of unknown function (DUF1780)
MKAARTDLICGRDNLAALRKHAAETRSLFSNVGRAERERMIVRAYLRCLGIPFTDSEIFASTEEPIDVRFRTALFQIMEIIDGRKRGQEWAEREQRYKEAQAISDVVEPYVGSTAVSFDKTIKMIADSLAEKSQHYGFANCAALDALTYIDLENSHLWPTGPGNVAEIYAELERQGWRSVSMIFLPYGMVLTANASAPEFIRSKIGHLSNAWPGPDGWFER